MTPGWLSAAMDSAFGETYPACPVCADQQRVQLVAWEGHRSTTHTTAHCPHCSNRVRAVPYVELPFRVDTPRGAA